MFAELTDDIAHFTAKVPGRVILMGDFNTGEEDPQIGALKKVNGVVDAIGTLPERQRTGHVDWIFLRGLRCVQAGTEDKAVSDHPFYWADVEFNHDGAPRITNGAATAPSRP